MATDLEQLAAEISTLGAKVKELKTANGDADAIKSAVAQLLTAKKAYADANNGIGVDGKPYQDGKKSKAEKKAAAKADNVGPAKPVSS